MSVNTNAIGIVANFLIFSTAGAQSGYTVEVLEQVAPWPYYVATFQNEREDYALVYPRSGQLDPSTHVVVDGQRYVLRGFEATGMNGRGQLCGRMKDHSNPLVGVIWSPDSGYKALNGRAHAYPSYIGDNGDVGGSIGLGYAPCLWRGNDIVHFPNVTGNVSFVIERSGFVAGHFRDGGHGNYAWLGDTSGKAHWINVYLLLRKSLPDNLILAADIGSYGGSSKVLNPATGVYISIGPPGSNSVNDMNASFVGVGNTYHDIAWGRPRPAIWVPKAYLQWIIIDPYEYMPAGWSDMTPRQITNNGAILATARFSNGPLMLIRLRPTD